MKRPERGVLRIWRRDGGREGARVRQIGRVSRCRSRATGARIGERASAARQGRASRSAQPKAAPQGRGPWMARVNPRSESRRPVKMRARDRRPEADDHSARHGALLWWPRRPLATLDRKPRQGRKAATVSVDAGAEVSRRGHRHFHALHENPKIRSSSYRADGDSFASAVATARDSS